MYDFFRRPRNTTYHHDSESDLDYAMARYYASRSGRFMTPDPGHVGANVGDPQSWNAYPYSRNDPVNLVDPTGKAYDFCILVYCERDVPDKELLTRLGGLSGLNGPLMDDSRKYSLGGDYWKLGERGPILQRGKKVGDYLHKSFDTRDGGSEPGLLDYAEAFFQDAKDSTWTGKTDAIGAVYGLWGIPTEGISMEYGQVQYKGNLAQSVLSWIFTGGGKGAITIGGAGIYPRGLGPETVTDQVTGQTLGYEESFHSEQARLYGPLYLPLNALGGLLGLTSSGYWHGGPRPPYNGANFMENGPHSRPPKK